MRRSTQKLVRDLYSREYVLTDIISNAIFILDDGRMVDGGFDEFGCRCIDHSMIEFTFEGGRYAKHFWEKVHRAYRLVRLVPECKVALINKGQRLTEVQKEILSRSNYKIERY